MDCVVTGSRLVGDEDEKQEVGNDSALSGV